MALNVKKTIDASASGVTDWIDMTGADSASITVVVPNGPVGTLIVEGSDDVTQISKEKMHDISPSTAAAANIATLGTFTAALTVNGTGFTSVAVFVTVPAFIRLKYTRSSSSGTITAHFTGRC